MVSRLKIRLKFLLPFPGYSSVGPIGNLPVCLRGHLPRVALSIKQTPFIYDHQCGARLLSLLSVSRSLIALVDQAQPPSTPLDWSEWSACPLGSPTVKPRGRITAQPKPLLRLLVSSSEPCGLSTCCSSLVFSMGQNGPKREQMS